MRSGIDLYANAQKVDLAAFRPEFAGCASASRLELLPAYSVASETSALSAYLDGTRSTDFNSGWHEILRGAASRGATFRRLRALPADITPYLRFEFECAYTVSAGLGEDIRFVAISDLIGGVGPTEPLIDFWIFDQQRAYLMFYDARGAFLGVARSADEDALELNRFLNEQFERARDLEWASQNAFHSR